MVDRLSGDDKKIFRNSLVDNALELTNLVVGADWGAKICWAGVFGRDGC
jgi:hypothetical protein